MGTAHPAPIFLALMLKTAFQEMYLGCNSLI